ncbi:MAG: nuclear transport factor 2 family protein [Chloroflexota bacterium]
MAAAEDDVRAAEEQLRGAITTQNWAELESMLAQDLIYTHANAMVQDKAAYLAGLAKMAHRYACERRNLVVRVYGDTALMAGRQINTTVGLGVTYHQVIQLWRKIDARWRLEAQQSTRLPQPE